MISRAIPKDVHMACMGLGCETCGFCGTNLGVKLAATAARQKVSRRCSEFVGVMVSGMRDYAADIEIWRPEQGITELENKLLECMSQMNAACDLIRRELPPEGEDVRLGYGSDIASVVNR